MLLPGEKCSVSGLSEKISTKKPLELPVPSAKSSGRRTRNGDIQLLTPTGQRFGGVAASQTAVKYDLLQLRNMFSCYQKVADQNDIQASVIAALASRVSGGGARLYHTNGYVYGHKAYGILQCHLETSGLPCEFCPWNSCCHIQMMVSMLLMPYIKQVQSKHPTWTKEMALQGGVAAYNFGVKNVQTWGGLDRGSANDDFSNDVMARAQYLYSLGWN
ncbi:goose-type lysozyme 2 [Plakobranchus ocellatus]|uniref:Goose-type lysozyme 2 n=1 Tax=Plakobranchus ocellatus TaxID=259542 RepID=A0AAV3Y211_9GAST|nr:goose-type lysozyme 2 [Plakobranchus ocellatus]